MAENNLGNTQYFRTKPDQELQVKEVLDLVYTAMDEKGYDRRLYYVRRSYLYYQS